MRRRLFNAWCIVSLLMAVVLGMGYVRGMAVELVRISASGSARVVRFSARHGKLRCFLESFPPGNRTEPLGFHASAHTWRFDPRESQFSLEFSVSTPASTPAGVLYGACPLWFLCAACLVSPGIWLTRRRRQRLA